MTTASLHQSYTRVARKYYMPNRDKAVRVSEEDKELLDAVKQEMYGTTTPSYGETIKRLCEEYLGDTE